MHDLAFFRCDIRDLSRKLGREAEITIVNDLIKKPKRERVQQSMKSKHG